MKRLLFCIIMLLSFNATAGKLADSVRAAGYKGIHQLGIGHFLYKVKHGKNISTGKNWVFWSDITERVKKADKKFEATQLIDGYIIYKLDEYQNDEIVSFTIAVPGGEIESFMQYQTLRHRCHSFEGNLEFTTGLGATQIIPQFKPVDEATCPGK